MRNRIIILVVGESGTGKTTVCEKLCERYGLKQVVSYTTRPRRTPDEVGHIFITEADMPDKAEMCAYTNYNGNHYFATHKQVDEADLYVVDPAGIDYFMEHYTGKRVPKVVRLTAHVFTRIWRMLARGDTDEQILNRVRFDAKAFANVKADVVIENMDINACVKEVFNYLCEENWKLMSDETFQGGPT